MAFDLTAASPILKVRYLGTLRKQLANYSYLWSQIKKKIQPVSGGSFQITMHTGRNVSAAYPLAEGGTLETPGQQGYASCTVPNKYLYGGIQVSGQAIAAARDSAGAFVQALESEIDGLQRDVGHEMNRLMHSDGLGAYGYCVGADDATPANFDDDRGNATITLPSAAVNCDLVDANNSWAYLNTDGITGRLCTKGAVGASSTAVAWTGGNWDVASADGDALIRHGSKGLYPMGIRGIINDDDPPLADLQGLDSTTYGAYWKAQVLDNSGTNRPLAFEDMQGVIDRIAINSSYNEKDIGQILMNYGVRRAYYKLCIVERRHVNTMDLDGGWKAIDFNGMPLMVDAHCRHNRIYFINFDTMAFIQTADWDWMDKDGSYLSRVSGTDAYGATLFMYGNLACYARNGNGLLDDLIEE